MDRDGPEEIGLTFMGNCESENIVAGSPVETGHNYFLDETKGLSAGVWECTPYTAEFEAYPVDEFCHILAGQVTITDGDGHAETFVAGGLLRDPERAAVHLAHARNDTQVLRHPRTRSHLIHRRVCR